MDTAEVARERIRSWRGDLFKYGREALKIRGKGGDLEPLLINGAQMLAHTAVEQQEAEHGWVRALVLKARQQGLSTYIAGRYYRKTALTKGVNTYILSHEQASADALFKIVDRFQRHNPVPPHVGTSNIKELVFDRLDSSYVVATAGAKEGGRSRTTTLFHGSEVAFWNNAAAHFAASVQTVPLLPGTEVILESTSAGPAGEFYERWQDAEAGRGDYIPIFIPWFVTEEYCREPEVGFELMSDADGDGELSEVEYRDLHKLSLGQMCWRRNKIAEFRSVDRFKREYPADVSDAWTASDEKVPFINPNLVIKARKREREAVGPLILGVDPASSGGDRFAVCARRGFCVQWIKWRDRIDTLEGTAWIRSLIDDLNPARVNIDGGNIGAAIITNLKSLGPRYADVVRGVNFGATSEAKLARPNVPGPKLRRAEMWRRGRDWLELPEGASLPDMPEIQSDLASVREKPLLNGDFHLESKKDMKARGVRSPDLGDAWALTFASNEFFERWSEAPVVPRFGLPDQKPRVIQPQQYDLPPVGPTGWMG